MVNQYPTSYYSVLSVTLGDSSELVSRSLLSFSSMSTMSFICLGVRSTSSIDNSSTICSTTHKLNQFTSDNKNNKKPANLRTPKITPFIIGKQEWIAVIQLLSSSLKIGHRLLTSQKLMEELQTLHDNRLTVSTSTKSRAPS